MFSWRARTRMGKFLSCYRQDIYTRSQQLVASWETARAGLKADPSTPLSGENVSN